VIAYGGGGALDTVVDGHTGVLFHSQQVDCLVEAIQRFQQVAWDAGVLRAHAERFDRQVFRQQLKDFVDESVAAHAAGTRFA
jgi:hypothetical protein